MDAGLISWITAKRARAPVAWLVVTRGPDPAGAVDRLDPIPGESDEELAARVEDTAKGDARAFKESETYFVHVFREAAELPEARRALVVDVHTDKRTLEEDEHGILDITMRGMTAAHQTMTQLARLGLDTRDEERIRLWQRVTSLEDRMYSDLDRMRKMMLQEEEMQERREERKERAALFRKGLEQLEILLPVGMSYLLHGRKEGEAAAGVVEAKLLQDFVVSLTPEQQQAVIAQLDQIQRIALVELQQGMTKGTFAPEMVAPLVQRVMANLTREQVIGIGEALETEEQREKFLKLYAVRKHTLAEKTHYEMMAGQVAGELTQGGANGGRS